MSTLLRYFTRFDNWLCDHNFKKSDRQKAERSLFNELFSAPKSEQNERIMDALCDRWSEDNGVRWWVEKPYPGIGKPISFSVDEWNYKLLIIGFDFTGQVVVRMGTKPHVYFNDDGTVEVHKNTERSVLAVTRREVTPGIAVEYNEYDEPWMVSVDFKALREAGLAPDSDL